MDAARQITISRDYWVYMLTNSSGALIRVRHVRIVAADFSLGGLMRVAVSSLFAITEQVALATTRGAYERQIPLALLTVLRRQ